MELQKKIKHLNISYLYRVGGNTMWSEKQRKHFYFGTWNFVMVMKSINKTLTHIAILLISVCTCDLCVGLLFFF